MRKNFLIIITLIGLSVSIFSTINIVRAAVSVGASTGWYEMQHFSVMNANWIDLNYCASTECSTNFGWDTPYPVTLTSFSPFDTTTDLRCGDTGSPLTPTQGDVPYNTFSANGTTLYCQFYGKPVYCPAGQVMTSARFYSSPEGLDDEHVDASCANLAGATYGPGHWVKAPNPTNNIAGFKSAPCASNEVQTGVRMVGSGFHVDDEHVDAFCSPLSGATLTFTGWVAPDVLGDKNYFGYKTATCAAGEVMTGVSWYQKAINVDDEHVKASCSKINPAPSVKVFFSLN